MNAALTPAEHAALCDASDAIAAAAADEDRAALEACRTRGIAVEQWAGDEHGNIWRATVLRKHGARGAPMVHLLATTGEEAARMALRYVGARGWQQ